MHFLCQSWDHSQTSREIEKWIWLSIYCYGKTDTWDKCRFFQLCMMAWKFHQRERLTRVKRPKFGWLGFHLHSHRSRVSQTFRCLHHQRYSILHSCCTATEKVTWSSGHGTLSPSCSSQKENLCKWVSLSCPHECDLFIKTEKRKSLSSAAALSKDRDQ